MRARHKFGAVRTELDGLNFASKAEARYYLFLKAEQQTGEVLFFHRQVPIELPGKTKYVVDFQVFMADGTVRYIDVKGATTEVFKLKKRQVEALYPIEIEVVQA